MACPGYIAGNGKQLKVMTWGVCLLLTETWHLPGRSHQGPFHADATRTGELRWMQFFQWNWGLEGFD